MSAGAANSTNQSAVLKKIWPQDAIQDLFYDEAPLVAMLPKKTDWSGSTLEVVLQYGQINGRSTEFSRAKANKQASKKTKMSISTSDNFALWSVEHKIIVQTRNDKGALVKALEGETKSALKKFKRSVCWQVYGNGGGSIGRVATSTTLSSTTLTLRSAQSFRNIDVGDVLTFASDDGSGSSPAGIRTGSVEVTEVDPESLTVTVTPALNVGVPSIANTDFVFIDGDYANSMYGVEAYVPATAPSTSIWGMARSTQKRRLGGIRVGGKGMLIQEAVKKALKVAKDETASISHIFMSTDDFFNLEMNLGSTRQYADEKVGSVGFTGIQFVGGGSKPVKIFPDADCPVNVIRGFQMDTWTLHSMGEYPDFLNLNGGDKYMQEDASNSWEGRLGGYAQLYTDAPGYNFRLDMTVAP
jgi:hypothetical protein